MGGLNYWKTQKFRSEPASEFAKKGQFPACKGAFPDCPETPDLANSMCRTCPKTDGMKKPKLEE